MKKLNSPNILLKLGVAVGLYQIYSVLRDRDREISFKNKVVIISGGSRGLGLVLGKELAKIGAHIALLARDEHELIEAKKLFLILVTVQTFLR